MPFIYWIFLNLNNFFKLVSIGFFAFMSIGAKTPAKADLLTEIQNKYAKATYIKMDVEKVFVLSALNKEKKANGNLFLAPQGKFRLEMKEPEKSLIVIDGKDIWVVQYPLDEGDKIQVLHSKLKEQLKSQVLLSFLMGQGKIKKQFKVLDQKNKDGVVTISLAPKEEGTDLKDIKLVIDEEEKLIDKISYKDNLDNVVLYVFKNKKFNDKVDEKKFKFKVPKNSEVSEMN